MNRRTLIIAVALIIAFSYLTSQRSIGIPVSAEFGYDENGKLKARGPRLCEKGVGQKV